MLGSYGPSTDGKPYTKNFDPEESPSGILARSGSYAVRSRVVDDDGQIYAGTFECVDRTCKLCADRYVYRLGVAFQVG